MKIFCDLDGTLIDVSARNYRVYAENTTAFGGHPLQRAAYWDLKRKKTKWDQLLPLSGLPIDIQQQFLDEFIKKIESPDYLKLDTLFPAALAALDMLSAEHECYLVSLRRNRENLLLELEWLNLAPHFKQILTGHSESDGYDVKIALIKDRLGDDKGVIIGDTEADIVTGKELGLTTVAVKSGIRDEQFLAALNPDHLLNDISELGSLALFQN